MCQSFVHRRSRPTDLRLLAALSARVQSLVEFTAGQSSRRARNPSSQRSLGLRGTIERSFQLDLGAMFDSQ